MPKPNRACVLLLLLAGCLPGGAPAWPEGVPGAAPKVAAPPLEVGGHWQKLTAPAPGEEDEFGYAVAGAGDVDGDGYDDVLVGAYQDDDATANGGAAFVFMGAEADIDRGRTVSLLATDGAALDSFGLAVAGVGDLDGDGYDDLAVGAPQHDGAGAQAGAIYLFKGSGAGPVAGPKLTPGSPGSTAGSSLAGGADVDGDGFSDFVAGGPNQDGVGAAWVHGDGDGSLLATLGAAAPGDDDGYGSAVAMGDLDGDGYADVVVGAPEDDTLAANAGAVYLHPGGSGGPSTGDQRQLTASDGAAADSYGKAVAVVPDTDGDGLLDLAVGATGADSAANNDGAAWLLGGAASGPESSTALRIDAPDALDNAQFGISLAGLGDLDGDGYGDLLVGASGASADGISGGAAYIFAGSADGLQTTAGEKLGAPDAGSGYRFGRSVALVGDVNGNHVPDFVIGAYRYARTDDTEDTGGGGEVGVATGAAWLLVPACYDLDGDGTCSSADCDDLDPDAFPGAAALDSDVDCMRDVDGDGYGASLGAGAVVAGTDCDDDDAAVHPSAEERCNEVDDDCDGTLDQDAVDATWWAPDEDGDAWSAEGEPTQACLAPGETWVSPTFLADCDDADAAVHPGAVEVVGDGVDQDCSGADLAEAPGGKDGMCSAASGPTSAAWLLGLLALAGRARRRPSSPRCS